MRWIRGLPLLTSLLLVVTTGCGDGSGGKMGASDVAQAGALRLSIEDAAQMLAAVDQLPNDPEVVRALADFWIDYALLAQVMNQPEGIEGLSLASILEQQENQSLVIQLRDAVIQVDEDISEGELREIYDTERPGEQVRARHILLLFPEDATMAQRDSVRALAEDLRNRGRTAAAFGSLAEQFSADPGSASRGGDLGFFPRGVMVPEFEAGAFALQPGQISEVIETQFGLHIIRLEERDFPAFADIRDQLQMQIVMDRTATAESIFVAGVEERGQIRIQDDVYAVLREIAKNPEATLSTRAARRVLVQYNGGTYTAGDYRDFVMSQPAQIRPQIEMAGDEDLAGLLENLVRSELLVGEARAMGLTPNREEIDELAAELRGQYRELAEALGLVGIQPAAGENLNQAMLKQVNDLMTRVVRGEQDIFPLQALAQPLRAQFKALTSDAGVTKTVERVQALRAEGFTGTIPPSNEP
jgi:hypothetical protein